MMPEGEEAPAVGPGKSLTVFHCYVDAVVRTVEIPASGWFLYESCLEKSDLEPESTLLR